MDRWFSIKEATAAARLLSNWTLVLVKFIESYFPLTKKEELSSFLVSINYAKINWQGDEDFILIFTFNFIYK